MTPKEQYEARKAERKKRAEDMHTSYTARKTIDEADMLDMLDRFVTAAERIADALERQPQTLVSLGPTTMTVDPNSASGFRMANTFGAGPNDFNPAREYPGTYGAK